ncbi:MAG TPA: TIM barrel protein [Bryobacteraceae bacterium]|nr:TIM barrel protein [Bryobacteraceae bacterium]
MTDHNQEILSNDARPSGTDRRGFFRLAGAAAVVSGAGLAMAAPANRRLTEKEKFMRLAANSYPLRFLFKSQDEDDAADPKTAQMKKKYGTITALDYPQFVKDTFPGLYQLDLWSSLFGDRADESMFEKQTISYNGREHVIREFNPAAPSARKWLDQFASKLAATGTRLHHISNNAPRDICHLDIEKRKAGIAVAKKWLDGAAIVGAKTMRVNTGGPRIVPSATTNQSGYPRNEELAQYITNAVESFKEMADHGAKAGVKVTIENHWGLSANPSNVRAILEEVNHPFCEASPDFCNWEHEYMLYHGLAELAPYAHTTVHAKYWDRWKVNDIQRSTRVMIENGFKGVFALEYENGPWDGVEGERYLLKEVMAAL